MPEQQATLNELVEQSGLSQKAISTAAGISHTYLAKVLRGDVKRPGKAKIASILLALNKSIFEINSVLLHYDYRPLMHYDVHEILENNKRRKLDGSIRPQYGRVHLSLFLSALENLGGNRLGVRDRTPSLFFPKGTLLAQEFDTCAMEWETHAERDAVTFSVELLQALRQERRETYAASLEQGAVYEHYINRPAFEHLFRRIVNNTSSEWKDRMIPTAVQALANTASIACKWPEQCRMQFTEHRPAFHFLMQTPVDCDAKALFMAFAAQTPAQNVNEQMLMGFSTEDPRVIGALLEESHLCREKANRAAPENMADAFCQDLRKILSLHGLVDAFDHELETLMQQDGFVLY